MLTYTVIRLKRVAQVSNWCTAGIINKKVAQSTRAFGIIMFIKGIFWPASTSDFTYIVCVLIAIMVALMSTIFCCLYVQ